MNRTPLEQAMFDALRPFGRMGASFPIYTSPPPEHEVISCEDLLDTDRLGSFFTRAISAWSPNPSEEDQRAAASRFLRRYCGAIITASVIPLGNGVAFDVSIPRISLIIRNEMPLGTVLHLEGSEIFTCAERRRGWPVVGTGTELATTAELRERAFRSLFAENFVPAFERVREVVHISSRLAWANAAELIELLYEYGKPNLAYTQPTLSAEEWAPYGEDRAAIFFGETLPGLEGPNPIRGLLEWEEFDDEPGFPGPQQVRCVCCVNYIIPGRPTPYCRTCGLLDHEQRRELWRQFADGKKKATSVGWPPDG